MGNCIKKINIIQPESDDQQPFWSFYGDCCVCMENPVQTAIIRCGHTVLCRRCALALKRSNVYHLRKCPICREEIKEIVTFIPNIIN